MKGRRAFARAAAVLALCTFSAAALAHGGGHHRHHFHHKHHHHRHSGVGLGIILGAAALWHYAHPRHYYTPSQVVVVPAQPPVYIERADAQAAESPSYWYYCVDEKAYYPYVKQCPGGWQRVVPQPPPG